MLQRSRPVSPPFRPLQLLGELDPGRWSSLAVVLTGAFVTALDFFIVNVSVPSIRSNLHASFADIQLIIASYGLTYSVFLITGGRLGDIFGRKRMFMWAVTVFTFASLLCGLLLRQFS